MLDPLGPCLPDFLFPDGRSALEPVDRGPAGLERRAAVRRRRRHHDRSFTYLQRTHAVVDCDAHTRPFALDLVRDVAEDTLGHLAVRLVLEAHDVWHLTVTP